jgi:transcriptional regulator with XRE-family HTH domain
MAKHNHNMADVIKRAIRSQGWSLNQLGIKTGVDSGRLSRFMTGSRDLRLDAAGRLVHALGLRLVDPTTYRVASTRGIRKGVRAIPRKPPKRGRL